MNRHSAYQRFLAWPVIGTLSQKIGVRRDWSMHELPDHVLKDIGVSRSEILSLTRLRGSDQTRRQRGSNPRPLAPRSRNEGSHPSKSMRIVRNRSLSVLICSYLSVASLWPSSAEAITILNPDRGGYVFEYAQKYHRASRPIRIMGLCASACTLALTYRDTCVGPNAVLKFHSVFNAGNHRARLNQWVMGRYPPAIRSWVQSRGGLTSKPITLSGSELRRRVRRCA